MHYHDLLKENQGNCDKIWKIVNELANIKTKSRTDPNELITEDGEILTSSDEIAGLNEHFANIGLKMAQLISPVNDSIRMPCDKSCKNSFFLTPSTWVYFFALKIRTNVQNCSKNFGHLKIFSARFMHE